MQAGAARLQHIIFINARLIVHIKTGSRTEAGESASGMMRNTIFLRTCGHCRQSERVFGNAHKSNPVKQQNRTIIVPAIDFVPVKWYNIINAMH